MAAIKSITTVNTNAGWAARQRNTDGTELFVFCETPGQHYTMHQAEMAAASLRRHIANGGESYAIPMPEGIKVIKS